MEFPTIDKFTKEVAEKALDEITYEGKTIREWAEIIAKQQPCEDCISREQAIRATYGFERYTGIDEAPYEYAENILRDLPSVTPTRPKGKWKRISPAGIYECTNCNQVIMTSDIDCYKYCHGCGVRMEGEE